MVTTAFGGSLLLGLGAAAVLLALSVVQAFDLAPGPWWIGLGLALAVFAQLLAGVPTTSPSERGGSTRGRSDPREHVPLTTYLIGRGLQWRVVRVYAAAANNQPRAGRGASLDGGGTFDLV